ncbi:hypothetical protein [Luteibacter sp. Lutesp34]|uniref:hypothetical protein n=1 Tax=Luteibacter sp. Lutesp34 TaxID=3243030 RepID=UPI0039B52C0A
MENDKVGKNLLSQSSEADRLLTDALAFVERALASDDLAAASSGLTTVAGMAVVLRRHDVASQAYRAKHCIELGRARPEIDFAIGALLFEVHAARWREQEKDPPPAPTIP